MGNFEHNGLTNVTRKKHHQFQKFHISSFIGFFNKDCEFFKQKF